MSAFIPFHPLKITLIPMFRGKDEEGKEREKRIKEEEAERESAVSPRITTML